MAGPPAAVCPSDVGTWADAGLHDVAVDRFKEFVSALQEQDLRHGAMLEVLAAVAGDGPDVSEHLLRDTDFDTEFATLRQGAGDHHDGTAAGVGLGEAGQAGGGHGSWIGSVGRDSAVDGPHHCEHPAGRGPRCRAAPRGPLTRIYQAIDPDGYEEERYEQAVDLLEFGDAAGALDGLPHFDGEFSH